jgi:hypothetical protein
MMARESRARRDERRYGRPERLADLVLDRKTPRAATDHDFGPGEEVFLARSMGHVRDCIVAGVIDASEVFDHRAFLEDRGPLAFDRDIRGAVPPFERGFVQFRIPDDISPQIRWVGVAVRCSRPGHEGDEVYEALVEYPCPAAYARAAWVVCCEFVLGGLAAPGTTAIGILAAGARSITFLDENGDSVQPPLMSILAGWGDDLDWVQMWCHVATFDALLACRFMNRPETRLRAVRTDAATNRRRRDAGRAGLVEYHAIVLGPAGLSATPKTAPSSLPGPEGR